MDSSFFEDEINIMEETRLYEVKCLSDGGFPQEAVL